MQQAASRRPESGQNLDRHDSGLLPVAGQNRDRHDKNALGPICASLVDSQADQMQRGKGIEHLMVPETADGTRARGPVEDGECIDSLCTGFVLAAPETFSASIGLCCKSTDSDGPTGGGSSFVDACPEAVETAGPRIETRLASGQKAVPAREAPSIPSAMRVSPGTCQQP